MNRPSPFKLLDALTFGLASLLVTGLAVYVQTTPQSAQAYALTWTVAFCFWFVYAALIYARAKLLARYPLTLTGGILINPEKYHTSTAVLNAEVERITKLYEGAGFPNAASLIAKTNVWLAFRPGPFPHPQIATMKVMGFVTVGGEGGEVGYKSVDQPIGQTAFGHELGHVILGRAWNDWDEDRHHKFMKEHGLP